MSLSLYFIKSKLQRFYTKKEKEKKNNPNNLAYYSTPHDNLEVSECFLTFLYKQSVEGEMVFSLSRSLHNEDDRETL